MDADRTQRAPRGCTAPLDLPPLAWDVRPIAAPTQPVSRVDGALDKVRKLLALATSDNPHEAAAAAARAQALIERHRLQEWLDAKESADADPDPIIDAREEPLEVGRRIRSWKSALASTLAQANGCLAYTLDSSDRASRTREASIVLVGRSRDRAAVATLWAWLVKRIEWLSATHGTGHSKKWHDAFRMGVVDTLGTRLSQSQLQARADLDEHALVRVEPAAAAHRDALDRFVRERLKLGRGRGIRLDADAWDQGKNAGDDLDLP